jgi:hypothetical protein
LDGAFSLHAQIDKSSAAIGASGVSCPRVTIP